MSTNSPHRPRFDGEISVFRSPSSAWLVDRAERIKYGTLRWAALDLDSPLAVAALLAHQRMLASIEAAGPYPELTTRSVCSWAANLAAKYSVSAKDASALDRHVDDAVNDAAAMARLSSTDAVQRAIHHGVHRPSDVAVTLEVMMAIAERERLSGAMATLQSLAAGLDPSGGMFNATEQIRALCKQYPVLLTVNQYHVRHVGSARPATTVRFASLPDAAKGFMSTGEAESSYLFHGNRVMVSCTSAAPGVLQCSDPAFEAEFRSHMVTAGSQYSPEHQLAACGKALEVIAHRGTLADAGIQVVKTARGFDISARGVAIGFASSSPSREALVEHLVTKVQSLAQPIAEQMLATLEGQLVLPPGHHIRFNIKSDIRWVRKNFNHRQLAAYVRPIEGIPGDDQVHAEFRVFLNEPRGHLFLTRGRNFLNESVNLLNNREDAFHYGQTYDEVIGTMVASFNAALPTELRQSTAPSWSVEAFGVNGICQGPTQEVTPVVLPSMSNYEPHAVAEKGETTRTIKAHRLG